MDKNRPNIRQVEVSEIERFIANVGERPFRVKQIVEWLWQKHAHSFDDMTDLSKDLRKQLVEHFTFPALPPPRPGHPRFFSHHGPAVELPGSLVGLNWVRINRL